MKKIEVGQILNFKAKIVHIDTKSKSILILVEGEKGGIYFSLLPSEPAASLINLCNNVIKRVTCKEKKLKFEIGQEVMVKGEMIERYDEKYSVVQFGGDLQRAVIDNDRIFSIETAESLKKKDKNDSPPS